MVKRYLRKRLPLTKNQKTISQYFKNSQKPRIRRKLKVKKPSKEDDSSYILPSNTDETDDFDKLDLEEETIDSQLNSPVIDLTDDDDEQEAKSVKKYPKYQKRIRTSKSSKKSKGRQTIAKRGRRRSVKKKGENMNSFAELNHCYNKLSDLISQYNFSDIADVILKLNNDIKRHPSDKEENALFKEFKKINSVIKKKDDITMMCLSILNSQKNSNENNKDNNKCEKFKEEEPIAPVKSKKKEPKDEKDVSFLESLKGMNQSNYKYGLHFFNSKNGVYIYDPKPGKKTESLTMYCKKYTLGCRAKCVIYNNSNDVTMKGAHNHPGTPYNSFCRTHPEFKNKNWEHAQAIEENGKDIIIKQC